MVSETASASPLLVIVVKMLLQVVLLFLPIAATDIACGMLTTCESCRPRPDCSWCFIALGQSRCDPINRLSKPNNLCIHPLFDTRQGDHRQVCNTEYSTYASLSFDGAEKSEPTSPQQPFGLILKAPTIGQKIVSDHVNPLIDIQLLEPGMNELDMHDQICFWVYAAQTPIDQNQIDTLTTQQLPTLCNDRTQIMNGLLSPLPVPPLPSSYLIITRMRSSKTKVPRSGTSFALIDRLPIEIHEWSDLFREDYLLPTQWWSDRIEMESSTTNQLAPLVLFHNRGATTSRQLHRIPVSTASLSPLHRIPKIIHQIWTGGIDELLQFQDQLPASDKRAWFFKWRESCKALHPKEKGWKHMFWDTGTMRTFVLNHFPKMIDQYDAMDLKIKRTDLARMLILLVHGGTYVDIDFECLKPFETIVVYGREPLDVDIKRYNGSLASMNDLNDGTLRMDVTSSGAAGGGVRLNPPLLYLSEHQTNLPETHLLKGRELPNAFMASIQWHPLIWLITMEMLRRDAMYPNGYVTQTTGPHVFSEIVFSYLETYTGANVHILPIKALFPVYCLDKEEMRQDVVCVQQGRCALLYKDSVAVHHYAMSWYPEVAKHLGLK